MKIKKSIRVLLATVASVGIMLTMSSCLTAKVAKAFFDEDGPDIEKIYKTGKKISEQSKKIEAAAETEFSPEEEYFIGRSVAASILCTYSVYENDQVTSYVNKILQTLVLNSDLPSVFNGYHAVILDSDELNAFATPGGHILVTRGLVQNAGSEEVLAAVIAHELGHISKEHGINAIKTSRVNSAVKDLGLTVLDEYKEAAREAEDNKGNDFFEQKMNEALRKLEDAFEDMISESIDTLVNSGYSQVSEFEADEAALYILADSEYNPLAMNEMFQMLKANTKKDSTGFGKTHPKPETRQKKLQSVLNKIPLYDTDPVRTERYLSIVESI